MMIPRVVSLYSGALLSGLTASASAHEGHGLEGLHMHPSDLWGFALFGFVVAVAVALSIAKTISRD